MATTKERNKSVTFWKADAPTARGTASIADVKEYSILFIAVFSFLQKNFLLLI
ncbi:MAG: hypothetical protein WC878_01515 [Candidatus Paceibacterota bacterium]|jgi:hypothetical protein